MARNPFVTLDTVRLPLAEGDWVEAKSRLSFGEQNALTAASLRQSGNLAAGDTTSLSLDMASFAVARIEAWVVDWSFVDNDGKNVPVTRVTIESLDPAVATEITTALDAHINTLNPTATTATT